MLFILAFTSPDALHEECHGQGAQSMVAAAIRTIFTQPDKDSARDQLRQLAISFCEGV